MPAASRISNASSSRLQRSSMTPYSGPYAAECQKLKIERLHPMAYKQQRRVIDSIVRNPEQDQFIIAATGSGKTLLYELPGILSSSIGKTTIVFIPRVSIIQSEHERLVGCTINVEARYNQPGREDQELQNDRLFQAVNNPELLPSFILTTPNQLLYPDSCFSRILNVLCEKELVQRFVFDEVHMLLDKHTVLLQLPVLRQKYPNVPVTVLSASVSPATSNTLRQALYITSEAKMFPLDRSNLYYQILPKLSTGEDDKLGTPINPRERSQMSPVLHLARNVYPNQAGLVYCRKKSTCLRFAEILRQEGIAAKAFDADSNRSAMGREIFSKWQQNHEDVRILVSTNALSSGVHKSDVRFVVHTSFPTTGIDGYMQETGRAGRDGYPATCLLLYTFGDAFQVAHTTQFQTDCILALLWLVNSTHCRRRALLSYYDDNFFNYNAMNHRCCDVCDGMASGRPHLEITSLAGRVLEYIRDCHEEKGGPVGKGRLSRILSKHFNNGQKEPTPDMWEKLIEWLVIEQYLEVYRPGERAGRQIQLLRNSRTDDLIRKSRDSSIVNRRADSSTKVSGPRVHLPWSMRFHELHVSEDNEDFPLKWTEQVIRSLDVLEDSCSSGSCSPEL